VYIVYIYNQTGCRYRHPVVLVNRHLFLLSERTQRFTTQCFIFLEQHVSAIIRSNHNNITGKLY